MKNKEEVIALGKMKDYLSEWFAGPLKSKTVLGKYDSYERIYQLFEEGSEESIVFEHVFKADQLESEDALVSTAGIKEEELRGLIEQCIGLDRQIEEYKNAKAKPNIAQKGE